MLIWESATARKIAAASPYIIGLGKRAFYQQLELDIAQAYTATEKIMVENAKAADALEGMKAFLERRDQKIRRQLALLLDRLPHCG